MVRNLRYPFSPLQEIFLKAEEPFSHFDRSTPSAPSPPAATSEEMGSDPSRCLRLKALLSDAERQIEKGNALATDYAFALREQRRCVNYFGGRLLRTEDVSYLSFRSALNERASSSGLESSSANADAASSFRHPVGGIDFGVAEKGLDRRGDHLHHQKTSSLASKYNLMS